MVVIVLQHFTQHTAHSSFRALLHSLSLAWFHSGAITWSSISISVCRGLVYIYCKLTTLVCGWSIVRFLMEDRKHRQPRKKQSMKRTKKKMEWNSVSCAFRLFTEWFVFFMPSLRRWKWNERNGEKFTFLFFHARVKPHKPSK